MTGRELFRKGFLPTDCATSLQIMEWREAAVMQFGLQSWITEACCNGLDALEGATTPAPYDHLINGDPLNDAGVYALAFISDDELDLLDNVLDAQAVDAAQSEHTDWRG